MQDFEGGEFNEVLSGQLLSSAQATLAIINELRAQTLLKEAADQVHLISPDLFRSTAAGNVCQKGHSKAECLHDQLLTVNVAPHKQDCKAAR